MPKHLGVWRRTETDGRVCSWGRQHGCGVSRHGNRGWSQRRAVPFLLYVITGHRLVRGASASTDMQVGEILMQTGEKKGNADPNPRTSRSLTSIMNCWAAVLNNQGWNLGKQSWDKWKEGGVYQDLPGNHWTTYVTRVRRRSGLWRPQSYSLPPKQGLSSLFS